KRQQAAALENRRRLLEEEGLVRRSAALGHEEEAVLVATGRIELELRGEVRPRILLLERREGCHLRVAQARLLVDVVDAARERRLVVAAGPHALALLCDD